MSEQTPEQQPPAQQQTADGTVTVAKNGNGVAYDCFVSIGGAQFRFATFPAENVDAEIAETARERQAAAAPPSQAQ